MWKKAGIIILIVVILVGGFFLIKMKTAETVQSDVTVVKTITAEPGEIQTTVDADGTVRPREELDVKVRLSGIVEDVFVETGDRVREGDPIIRIEDDKLLDNLETAKIRHAEALNNYLQLLDTYNIQQEQNKLRLEEARQNIEMARAALEKERLALNREKETAERALEEREKALTSAKEELDKNRKLFENDAIPRKILEQSEDTYEQARSAYKQAKHDLDVLVNETIPTSLSLAELKVKNAENQLQLLKASIAREEVTQSDIELAVMREEEARRQVNNIKENLERVVTSAPINGTVIDLAVSEGAQVLEGSTVARIATVSDVIVEAMVDEIHINEVAAGQKVVITSDAFEGKLEGQITSVAPIATRVGNINKFKTEIEVEDDRGLLHPGMFVNAEIITNYRQSVITVPPLAVLGEDEKYVFIVSDGRAEKRTVELGLKNLTMVQVIGVEPGEEIIIGPYNVLKNLKPGAAVIPEGSGKGESGE